MLWKPVRNALLSLVVASSQAAADTSLVDALRAQSIPLGWHEGRIDGPGAQWLLERAGDAQFVLIGEDHGFADVPRFASALQAALGARRFDHLVVEAGAHSVQHVEQALRFGTDGLERLNRRFPFALPFLGLREEGELAAGFVRGNADDALWGIDQEFVLSAGMHFDRLQRLADTEGQRAALRRLQEINDAGWRRMIETRNPGEAPLLHFAADDLAALAALFAHGSEARDIVAALSASATIYLDQESAPYRSNTARATLMKREFMRHYRAAAARQPQPRALFKLGAFHAGRGLSPIGVYDIGNLASELAQSNGRSSLHLLVLAAGGEVNRQMPFSTGDADRRQRYDAAADLAVIDAAPLLAVAPREGAVLIDLAALRGYGTPQAAPGSPFNALLHAYDAVVLIAQANAATSY